MGCGEKRTTSKTIKHAVCPVVTSAITRKVRHHEKLGDECSVRHTIDNRNGQGSFREFRSLQPEWVNEGLQEVSEVTTQLSARRLCETVMQIYRVSL